MAGGIKAACSKRGLARTAGLAALLVAAALQAADPQPYTVSFEETGDATLNQTLADASTLLSLRDSAPASPFALVARAKADADRFTAALHSAGYYEGRARLKIAGRPLDDPRLYDLLDRAAADPPVPVTVSVETGPLFHLRKVDIQGELPASARARLGLAQGAPAVARNVLAARETLLNALRDDGYALATVSEPDAVLAEAGHALDISYTVETGPRVALGPITIKGLQEVDEAYLRRRLLVEAGDPFKPAQIEKARLDLAATGVFSSVRAEAADAVDTEGRLPIHFDVIERPKRATSIGAAYSTDLGGSLSVSWQHRNLFGGAEQLSLNGGVTQIGGNSTTGVGYKGSIGFVKPDFPSRDQSVQANLAALKQSLNAYDQTAVLGDVSYSRKFDAHWTATAGLAGEQSRITQQGVTQDYTLLSLPLTLKYDSSNSLLDPTEGIRASASLAPVQPLAGGDSGFVIAQLSGSAYLDLAEPGRSVLALRGLVGDVEGASWFELPPDKRFYAGGSATVRGYKYQSIGPQYPKHDPQGGTSIIAGTVEWRQRFFEHYGMAVFADLGQVNTGSNPLAGSWRIGAGLGLRYHTGFGPIRLDVALPVNKQPGSGSFEAYIGLGQAF